MSNEIMTERAIEIFDQLFPYICNKQDRAVIDFIRARLVEYDGLKADLDKAIKIGLGQAGAICLLEAKLRRFQPLIEAAERFRSIQGDSPRAIVDRMGANNALLAAIPAEQITDPFDDHMTPEERDKEEERLKYDEMARRHERSLEDAEEREDREAAEEREEENDAI